jgi:ABC-type nickel/cobalt efflux system permease component RcnA
MQPRPVFFFLLIATGFSLHPLAAHPMGNFSVSHYTRLEVSATGVEVTYALDLAEVPTYTLLRDWKRDAKSPQEDLEAKATEQAREWAKALEFAVVGTPVQPKFVRAEIKLSDGAGGLSVARIVSIFELAGVKSPLSFEDHNFPERAGWKEIVIRSGKGVSITKASQPDEERSKALTEYPADPTSAPPQDLRASVEWRTINSPVISPQTPRVIAAIEQPKPVEPAAAAPPPSATPGTPQSPGTVVKGDYLSRLIAMKQIPLGWLLTGLVVAFGFGAAHALTPGHGKTIVAAYLVGSRGTLKHATFLGAMVTFTHTISVFLLGLGVLFLSNIVKPEKITPVLGAISGLSIVAVGASLFYKRLKRFQAAGAHSHDHLHDHEHVRPHAHDHHHDHEPMHAHAHSHAHEHSHSHDHVQVQYHHDQGHDHHYHDHDHAHHHHDHGPHGHSHVPEGDITLGSLIALGASGGLVPCPSALVLLLASISFGHVGVGLILLVAFSIGLAGVLMAIGMMVLYAKTWLPDPLKTSRHPAFRLVPVLSAAVIVCIGLLMTGVSLGWVRPGLVG